MIVCVHQPQYLPWLGFFDKIDKSDCLVFLDNVQYKRREFQNRNKIRTKNGWIWLTVPVVSKGRYTQRILEVEIDNSEDWRSKHLKNIVTNYSHAKYFKEHIDFFKDLYAKKWIKLSDLNVQIIKYLLSQFAINKDIYFESNLGIQSDKTQRIIDICRELKADTYLSGQGGREYLEEGLFRANNIKLIYQDFVHPQYEQCYQPFIANLAAIDLLFNAGDESLKILRTKG